MDPSKFHENFPDEAEAVKRLRTLIRSCKNQEVGKRLFPATEAELIAELVERDLPHYDPSISEHVVTSMNRFAQDIGLLSGPVPYDQVVATRFCELWAE